MKSSMIVLCDNVLWKGKERTVNHNNLCIRTYYTKTVVTYFTLLTFAYLRHKGMSHLKIFCGCSNKQLVFMKGHIMISLTKLLTHSLPKLLKNASVDPSI
jgi:hypothetical protein